jgi:hypothetical protein
MRHWANRRTLDMAELRRSERKRSQTQFFEATETRGGTDRDRLSGALAREAAVASAYEPLVGLVQLGAARGASGLARTARPLCLALRRLPPSASASWTLYSSTESPIRCVEVGAGARASGAPHVAPDLSCWLAWGQAQGRARRRLGAGRGAPGPDGVGGLQHADNGLRASAAADPLQEYNVTLQSESGELPTPTQVQVGREPRAPRQRCSRAALPAGPPQPPWQACRCPPGTACDAARPPGIACDAARRARAGAALPPPTASAAAAGPAALLVAPGADGLGPAQRERLACHCGWPWRAALAVPPVLLGYGQAANGCGSLPASPCCVRRRAPGRWCSAPHGPRACAPCSPPRPPGRWRCTCWAHCRAAWPRRSAGWTHGQAPAQPLTALARPVGPGRSHLAAR